MRVQLLKYQKANVTAGSYSDSPGPESEPRSAIGRSPTLVPMSLCTRTLQKKQDHHSEQCLLKIYRSCRLTQVISHRFFRLSNPIVVYRVVCALQFSRCAVCYLVATSGMFDGCRHAV